MGHRAEERRCLLDAGSVLLALCAPVHEQRGVVGAESADHATTVQAVVETARPLQTGLMSATDGANPTVEVGAFGATVVAALRASIGGELVGAYFVGSVALGGYVPGESDIDIVAVSRRALTEAERGRVIEQVLASTDACPTRGLEFTLYRADAATAVSTEADFEVNVNGGPGMAQSVHRVARDEPWFWYVLDRAIAHRSGMAIDGPASAEVFADVPRQVVLAALVDSMRWHREHEKATLYSVLNACRAWRFAVDDVLGSKLDGARWARTRWDQPALIDAAVDLRHGRPAPLGGDDVDRLLAHVERSLSEAA